MIRKLLGYISFIIFCLSFLMLLATNDSLVSFYSVVSMVVNVYVLVMVTEKENISGKEK